MNLYRLTTLTLCLLITCSSAKAANSKNTEPLSQTEANTASNTIASIIRTPKISVDAGIFHPETVLSQTLIMGPSDTFNKLSEMTLPATFFCTKSIDAVAYTLNYLDLGLTVSNNLAIISTNTEHNLIDNYLKTRDYSTDEKQILKYLNTVPKAYFSKGFGNVELLLNHDIYAGNLTEYPSMIAELATDKFHLLGDIPLQPPENARETIGDLLTKSLYAVGCEYSVKGICIIISDRNITQTSETELKKQNKSAR